MAYRWENIRRPYVYETSSVETLTTYTKPMEGCALVNFDELPVEGSNWKSVSDKLKSLITEPEFDARTMHQTGYTHSKKKNLSSLNSANLKFFYRPPQLPSLFPKKFPFQRGSTPSNFSFVME